MSKLQILSGLREIATDYDGLICDVWGVLHDGLNVHAAAAAALQQFRATRGKVIMLSNAPRPPSDVESQFRKLGVPADCYDAIVTSGGAAQADLMRRVDEGQSRVYHLGPERDRNLFTGLKVERTDLTRAEVVLCSGLFDDDTETPDDYKSMLAEMRAHSLTMLCANPDWVVQRGGALVYCAGALANAYEKLGGKVIYYGKPMAPVYALVREHLNDARRPLAVGDGMHTDIKGANGMGIDALFVADGIHGEEIGAVTPEAVGALLAKAGVHARAAMRALVW